VIIAVTELIRTRSTVMFMKMTAHAIN